MLKSVSRAVQSGAGITSGRSGFMADYTNGFDRELELKAVKNKPIPDGLSLAEQKAYVALRAIYRDYREGKISKNTAKSDKDEIIAAFTREKGEEVFLSRKAESLKKRIFNASQAYAENPTTENADLMYAAFWGKPVDWRQRE